MGKEIVPRRGDGAKGRHSEETEAKVGGEGSRVGAVNAILIPARVANDSEVGSEGRGGPGGYDARPCARWQ